MFLSVREKIMSYTLVCQYENNGIKAPQSQSRELLHLMLHNTLSDIKLALNSLTQYSKLVNDHLVKSKINPAKAEKTADVKDVKEVEEVTLSLVEETEPLFL